ncbi:LysR family transcriptional regulator [Nonomuraea sp. B12E4]|uniref:LysR family transcriptional regulator n=1 Tax=Nonomuraea sp. B12E4 TaxID=3153564 RepID=UPI00325E6CBD
MDTRLLRSFVAVVRTGGITAAAAELGFVQSTVTAHVQTLERLAGTRLLDRIPAGTTPTRAGALLAGRAQELLDLEERMFAEIAADGGRATGTVRLCAPESVCGSYLAALLPEVRRRYPDVRLSLMPATTRVAFAALADRRADLALALEPSVRSEQSEVTDLGVQELALIAPATTELPRDRPITPAELAEGEILLQEEGCSYSDELAALIAAASPGAVPPRFGSVETVKRCVEAGLGLALLPRTAVATELSAGRLAELRPPSLAEQHLWLLRPRSRWMSPAVAAVLSMLAEAAPAPPGGQ